MSLENKLVIFDLDGTLVDSNRDLIPALNVATASQGLPPISIDDVGHVVGQGALKMIEKSFAFHNVSLEVGGEAHQSMLGLFLEYYEDHIADYTVFFDGVLASLGYLKKNGCTLAVCTNKFEHLARKLLVELGQIDQFSVITGGDSFSMKKPDPRHLIETASLAKFAVRDCIMVGDSINDIAAARAANIPVIAVDFGYSDVPVQELKPDVVISHFDALFDAVTRLRCP